MNRRSFLGMLSKAVAATVAAPLAVLNTNTFFVGHRYWVPDPELWYWSCAEVDWAVATAGPWVETHRARLAGGWQISYRRPTL